jgi:hypothetical protein
MPKHNNEDDEMNTLSAKQVANSLFFAGALSFVLFILALLLISMLTSCTITQTLVHTEGTASDVVDETETTSPDVRPTTNLTVPLKAI